MKHRRMAFTLVELIMVIVIIGLLAAVVTPKFVSIKSEAQNAAEIGTVSAVRAGIKIAYMATLAQGGSTYPATLDSAALAAASDTNPLFTTVLDGGLTDGNWTKSGAAEYTYTPTSAVYDYTAGSGTFIKQ